MNNAASFLSAALYEAMTRKEDDSSRKENTKEGNRQTREHVNTDVRREKTTSSTKKSPKTRTTKKNPKKSGDGEVVLVLESELEGDK